MVLAEQQAFSVETRYYIKEECKRTRDTVTDPTIVQVFSRLAKENSGKKEYDRKCACESNSEFLLGLGT